ncbi:MAG: M42 family metallopeptidase [Desulfitobacteriia bacterium]|jgi:putative aminopeptidase FrvX
MVNKELNLELLKGLTQAYGPSGNEKQVAKFIENYIQDQIKTIDTLETDTLGNLIVRKKGPGKKIMVAAHMDEIGLIATYLDSKGYIYFSPVGGLKPANLLAQRVMFGNGSVGVIAKERKESGDKSPAKYFIDLGVTGEQEARKYITEGDMAVLTGQFVETDNHVISKALDNRLGCFITLEALKNYNSEHDLYVVFTAQEEVGTRGAKTAAYALEPDLAIVVDMTFSYDTPKEKHRTSLDKGVAIKIMDRSILVTPKIKNWMLDVATENNIPYQTEIITAGGTDSGPIHLSQEGIPTGGLAVPVRYLHTGSEIASKSDIKAACRLLTALLEQPLLISK